MRGTLTRAALAALVSASILGPPAARAGNQLFEGSWTVKAFGNELTGGTGASKFYSAYRLPQGIQCNPNQPRCPFTSTPTNGMGTFSRFGGSLMEALYCAPWYNWRGFGTSVRPAKGATYTVMGIEYPPLYRNPGFFTSAGQPDTLSCQATTTDGYGGKGWVQIGQPITGTKTASTTGTQRGGFYFSKGSPSSGIRATGVIGELPYKYQYFYRYTYATLRNSKATFGPGNGPGNFTLGSPFATVRVKQGTAKFGGTMRMLGAFKTKVCYFYNGCSLANEKDCRYDAIGAAASTYAGYVTAGYVVTDQVHYYNTQLMNTYTVSLQGERFPWTTGSVTVRATARGPHKTVHYAKGFDNRNTTTPSGFGTIQLVTPVLTRWMSPWSIFETAGIGILRIKFIPPPPPVAPILQPAGVSTDMGTSAGAISNVVDQSGLFTGYTSEETEFDDYISSTSRNSNVLGTSVWVSSLGTSTGNVDFDLGGTFFVRSLALWNAGSDFPENITGITLLADDNAGFSSPVALGSFTPNPNTGPYTNMPPEVFAFTPTSASHVRMQITSNNGATNTGFGEAAFEVLLDLDGDGVFDVYETDTGTYVSPTNTGTDPTDADSDDDGLDDGAELALGTAPNDPDHDADGICDGDGTGGGACAPGLDNCPFVSNFSQANSDTLAAGDACQCGDVDNADGVTSLDVAELREALMGGSAVANPNRCNVIGPSDGGVSDCNIADVFVLQRFLAGSPVTVANTCDAYLGL
jgi:hypothetical protein